MPRSTWKVVLATVVILVGASLPPLVSAPSVAAWAATARQWAASAVEFLQSLPVPRDLVAAGSAGVLLLALLARAVIRSPRSRRTMATLARRGHPVAAIARSARVSQDAVRLVLSDRRS
jgi:hypothetical protein